MTVYTYSEARRKLATLLETASAEGEVRIKRRNGEEFIVRPSTPSGSPLDVEGVDLGLTADEIVEAVREGRERAGT